ncbi:flagellar basal body rod protein FlgF [Vibrio mediterranei]|uniref:flagellar basal body rod protein FlgF n=1 Tax=Vibrio mediterranei TaxID=689 RepID=UPI004068C7A7
MNPILFNAAKGAERAMHAQHARANNLSNAETVGFKALLEYTTPMRLEGSGFESSVTTRTNLTTNDFTQGQLIKTDRALDVAVNGHGFIAVEGRKGELEELYTRSGEMEIDAEGFVHIHGRSVLTDGGPLQLPDFQDLHVGDSGLVTIIPPGGGVMLEVGQIKLVNPDTNTVTLDKTGLFKSKDNEVIDAAVDVSLKSGFVEGSNVSGFSELVGIMNLTRQFEVQVKVMSKADELARISNSLMRV